MTVTESNWFNLMYCTVVLVQDDICGTVMLYILQALDQ
jgi:hypothetical protein